MKTKTIKLTLILGLFALFLTVASAYPLAWAKTPDELQDDINYVRGFMQQYESELNIIAGPRGYGDWGYKVDTDGLARLNELVREAQIALYRERYDEVASLLQQWEGEWNKYDSIVTQQIQDIDFRWLNQNLIPNDVLSVDKWLGDLKNSGYQIDEFITQWNDLRKQILFIQSSWPQDPAKWQSELYTWLASYSTWSHRIEAKITAQDRQGYEQWLDALKEWIKFDHAYFDAESKDIANAAKDELQGAKEDLDFLENYRPILDKAEVALSSDPATTDQLLNQIDKELMQHWSKGALQAREQLNTWDKEFLEWLQGLRKRIDTLRQKGWDVSDLEKSFKDASDGLADAKGHADTHCSTYVECGEGLNEYNGYYAISRYHEFTALKDWWEETLKSYETSEVPTYYVVVSVEPVTVTDLGDRITGPVTIKVDAPGAKKVEVYLRQAENYQGIGDRKLLGTAEYQTDGKFTLNWAADEPYDMAEITATAYGQPDVNYSRTSDPYIVILPRYNASPAPAASEEAPSSETNTPSGTSTPER